MDIRLNTASYSPTLLIRSLDPSETDKIGQVVRDWQQVADALRAQSVTDPNRQRISDASYLCGKLLGTFANPHNSIHVCCSYTEQRAERIHGIAVSRIKQATCAHEKHTDNVIYLRFLLGDPANLDVAANTGKADRVVGTGTALIRHLAQQCLQEGHAAIVTQTVPSATTFYEKQGFERTDDWDIGILLGPSHVLTKEKIDEMVGGIP